MTIVRRAGGQRVHREASDCAFVPPIMTRPCRTNHRGGEGGTGLLADENTAPKWEEELVIDEDYKTFLNPSVRSSTSQRADIVGG